MSIEPSQRSQPRPAPPKENLVAEAVTAVTDLDMGMWRSLRDSFVRPAELMRSLLAGERHYVPALRFLVLVGGFYALVITLTTDSSAYLARALAQLELDGAGNAAMQPWLRAFRQVMIWLQQYQSLIALVFVPVIAGFSRSFFGRLQPSYRAHLYGWAYAYAQYYLVFLPFGVLYLRWQFTQPIRPSSPAEAIVVLVSSLSLTVLTVVMYGFLGGRLLGVVGWGKRLGLGALALLSSSILGAAIGGIVALLIWAGAFG